MLRNSISVALQRVDCNPTIRFKWEFFEIYRKALFRKITIYGTKFSAELWETKISRCFTKKWFQHRCFQAILIFFWNTRFFYKQRFFLTQCCLTFSWTELQKLLRCCLIHVYISILRHILYLVHLCPCLVQGLFMPYLCDLFFIFSLNFIVINHDIASF